ncbi:CCR4-NOT transcription complex subunit 4-like [Hibiscus syriacus]|uniref:CCR4-NOT transcription complex subunit 4-like n=1 Tax=Hibiscus syriacus TaxID=106335 RepID=UPI001922242C|nr:CCR4-NOT transcription complex subunit 4-like [Hibiscus syriacus]
MISRKGDTIAAAWDWNGKQGARFGTTKYCHAWLRNLPCSNPDCLYLHEIGSQEDSFTKDEIISTHTRSRVQQITSAINNMQLRAGNILPPHLDDYCPTATSSASAVKSIAKNAPNNKTVHA